MGLCLAVLRVDILRLRYALARVHGVEQSLLERHRGLTADAGRLRDPGRLRRLASERGFGLPERVIRLDAPPAVAAEPAS